MTKSIIKIVICLIYVIWNVYVTVTLNASLTLKPLNSISEMMRYHFLRKNQFSILLFKFYRLLNKSWRYAMSIQPRSKWPMAPISQTPPPLYLAHSRHHHTIQFQISHCHSLLFYRIFLPVRYFVCSCMQRETPME